MSLKIIHLALEVEHSDDFHVARLLLLLQAAAGKSGKPIQGIMKLAKMDFLLRYPNCLARVLTAVGKEAEAMTIPDADLNTIEAKMIRFRYGPWDKRYRRWISLMVSRGLAHAYLEGKTVNVKISEHGSRIAEQLRGLEAFSSLEERSALVVKAVGNYSATKLKDFIYKEFPEIVDMRWGKEIEL